MVRRLAYRFFVVAAVGWRGRFFFIPGIKHFGRGRREPFSPPVGRIKATPAALKPFANRVSGVPLSSLRVGREASVVKLMDGAANNPSRAPTVARAAEERPSARLGTCRRRPRLSVKARGTRHTLNSRVVELCAGPRLSILLQAWRRGCSESYGGVFTSQSVTVGARMLKGQSSWHIGFRTSILLRFQ